MEYTIISGRVKEVRRVRMEPPAESRTVKRRGVRVKGSSTEKKILRNEEESVKRLARIINANYGEGDLWLQLLYPGDGVPELEEAKKIITKVLRRIKQRFFARTGKALRYILVDSDTDPRTGEKTVAHHHLVMDRIAWEDVAAEWPVGRISYKLLDNRGDYTGIARYMIEQAAKGSKNKWRCSQGLKKPVYTIPVPIDAEDLGEQITPPKGAEVRESTCTQDEESGARSSYLRCVMPAQPQQASRGIPRPMAGEEMTGKAGTAHKRRKERSKG